MAIQIIREVVADVVKRGVTKTVYAKQHDVNSRFLDVRIQDEGKDIVVAPTSTVLLNVERADRSENMFYGTVNDTGTVRVPMTTWMLENAGSLICDISIVDIDPDIAKLTTMSFTIYVEAAVVADETFVETEDYSAIADLLKRAESSAKMAIEAAAAVEDLEYIEDIRIVQLSHNVYEIIFDMSTGISRVAQFEAPTGAPGADGKTPVRGVDFYTEEDKEEIINDVLASLPTWEGGSY